MPASSGPILRRITDAITDRRSAAVHHATVATLTGQAAGESGIRAAASNVSGELSWTGEGPGGPGQLPAGRANYHVRAAPTIKQMPGASGRELGG